MVKKAGPRLHLANGASWLSTGPAFFTISLYFENNFIAEFPSATLPVKKSHALSPFEIALSGLTVQVRERYGRASKLPLDRRDAHWLQSLIAKLSRDIAPKCQNVCLSRLSVSAREIRLFLQEGECAEFRECKRVCQCRQQLGGGLWHSRVSSLLYSVIQHGPLIGSTVFVPKHWP